MDSPVLCLHCHQSFCSRSLCTTELSRTSFELLVSCFFLKSFVLSSWSWAVPEVKAFLRKTPAHDLVSPSANCTRAGTHIKPDRFVSLPTPAEHLSRRDATVNAVPRSSGTLASLARQSNKLSQSVITRIEKRSSVHHQHLRHNMARVFSARSSTSRQALASVPKVDRMVRIEDFLFQVRKILEWLQFSRHRH